MKPSRVKKALCIMALLATSTLTGCMAQRPFPYNRRSINAKLDRHPTDSLPPTRFARWQQPANDQMVATTTANSSRELDVSLR
jgi:hypothetical protein